MKNVNFKIWLEVTANIVYWATVLSSPWRAINSVMPASKYMNQCTWQSVLQVMANRLFRITRMHYPVVNWLQIGAIKTNFNQVNSRDKIIRSWNTFQSVACKMGAILLSNWFILQTTHHNSQTNYFECETELRNFVSLPGGNTAQWKDWNWHTVHPTKYAHFLLGFVSF